jgi:uncharacterized membrane protein
VHTLFSHLCNQARCFVIDGTPLPLCQRCFGLYSGAALTFLLIILFPALRRGWPPRPIIFLHITALLLAMAGGLHFLDPNPAFRLLCGLLTGHVALFWLFCAGAELHALRLHRPTPHYSHAAILVSVITPFAMALFSAIFPHLHTPWLLWAALATLGLPAILLASIYALAALVAYFFPHPVPSR